jgi:hypothetical protein
MGKKEGHMIDLTEEQRRELENETPRVRDPLTGETYVLVHEEFYRKMRAVIDGFARRSGWDDPEMDVYDELYGDKT